jgi:hypothetical protein
MSMAETGGAHPRELLVRQVRHVSRFRIASAGSGARSSRATRSCATRAAVS